MKLISILVVITFITSCNNKVDICDFSSFKLEISKQYVKNGIKGIKMYSLDTINDTKELVSEITLNSKGYPKLMINYQKNEPSSYETSTYDDQNNFIKEKKYGKNLDSLILTYRYERSDNLETIYYYDEGNMAYYEIYTNDNNGRNKAKMRYNSDSMLVNRFNFEWSEKNGNQIVKSTMFDSDSIELGNETFTYKNCRLIKSILIKSGDTIETVKNKYNSQGLLYYTSIINFIEGDTFTVRKQYSKDNLILRETDEYASKYYKNKKYYIYEYSIE